jgi:hypothetical protein
MLIILGIMLIILGEANFFSQLISCNAFLVYLLQFGADL